MIRNHRKADTVFGKVSVDAACADSAAYEGNTSSVAGASFGDTAENTAENNAVASLKDTEVVASLGTGCSDAEAAGNILHPTCTH